MEMRLRHGAEVLVGDGAAVIAVEWPKEAIATWIPTGTRLWKVGITVDFDDFRTIEITPPDSSNS